MRKVDRDELIWNTALAMQGMTLSLARQLASPEPDRRRQAREVLAAIIVDKGLARYAILIDAPEPPSTRFGL